MNTEAVAETSVAARWRVEGVTHIGKRASQEDALGLWHSRDARSIFAVVADGAGGHGGGAAASNAAVAEAGRRWKVLKAEDEAAVFLAEWLSGAHEAVNREARKAHKDARTVAVVLLARGNRADWVHAGDSRLYHFRDGQLLSRTRDDSVVQVLFEQGEISEEAMGHHEDQNRLLQAIGGAEAPRPRLGGADLQPGDVFLLCSDGLWENLDPAQILELASTPPQRWRKALNEAAKNAIRRGGEKADNTSAILAGYGVTPPGSPSIPAWRLTLVLLLAAVAALLFIRPETKNLWQGLKEQIRARLEQTRPSQTTTPAPASQ